MGVLSGLPANVERYRDHLKVHRLELFPPQACRPSWLQHGTWDVETLLSMIKIERGLLRNAGCFRYIWKKDWHGDPNRILPEQTAQLAALGSGRPCCPLADHERIATESEMARRTIGACAVFQMGDTSMRRGFEFPWSKKVAERTSMTSPRSGRARSANIRKPGIVVRTLFSKRQRPRFIAFMIALD